MSFIDVLGVFVQIPFFKHDVGLRELWSIYKVFRSPFLTAGPVTAEFEHKLSQYLSPRTTAYAVGLNSCTAALHLSLLACGIGPGDEVITTSLTFAATALAIIHCGAIPVFVDVEPETGNINPNLIEKAITKSTRAILPVHLYGRMCNMPRISKIAVDHKLDIIEDAAHALESSYCGVSPGQLSTVACFSFYATKSITSGEGGAAFTTHKNIEEKIRLLRCHGMSAEAAKRFSGVYSHWDLVDLGWKYNMNDIQAAMLLSQLCRANDNLAKRRKIAQLYEDEFNATCLPISCLAAQPGSMHARHLFTINVPAACRDSIMVNINRRGVGTTVNYTPVHALTAMKGQCRVCGDLLHTVRLGASTISLPLYPSLTHRQTKFVIEAVLEAVKQETK